MKANVEAAPDASPDWRPAVGPPQLLDGEVHVWRVSVAEWRGAGESLLKLLGAHERDRASRFRFARDREQYVVAHGVQRWLLGHYTAQPAASLRFDFGPAGKPFLLPAMGSQAVEFNLSHSGDLVLLAVTESTPVGVDVERWSPEVEFAELIERFFSPNECVAFRGLPPEQHCAAFFACWARKEAYIKATGLGVSEGLDYFDVPVGLDQAARLIVDRHDDSAAGRWQLTDLAPAPGYSAALATTLHPERIRQFSLRQNTRQL